MRVLASLVGFLVIGVALSPGADARSIDAIANEKCDSLEWEDGTSYVPVTYRTYVGTNGNDHILGTEFDDTIRGKGGHDVICGRRGADTIYGGKGHDFIAGGANPEDTLDVLDGGAGRDVIYGMDGRDAMNGGGGADECHGAHPTRYLGGDSASGCETTTNVP